MQYPTPQFIEAEGKIIYFLTFRQFFWLVGGGATCIPLFLILPKLVFAFVGLAVMLAAGAMAFVRVNNASILHLLMNYIGFSIGKKTYTWKKKESAYPFKIQKRQELTALPETPTLRVQESKLREVQKRVDTRK